MQIRRLLPSLVALAFAAVGPTIQATTVVQPTFDSLVGSSDYIVRAVVKSVKSEWRDNAAKPGQRYIGSSITLEVKEVIKGAPPDPLVLEVVGGRVGADQLTIDGAPTFTEGEESVLFVRGNGRVFFPLVGLMHGYFPVRQDEVTGRSILFRYDGSPVYGDHELEPAAANPSAVRGARDRPMTAESFSNRIHQQQSDILSREKLR